jgi:hypothetical protein
MEGGHIHFQPYSADVFFDRCSCLLGFDGFYMVRVRSSFSSCDRVLSAGAERGGFLRPFPARGKGREGEGVVSRLRHSPFAITVWSTLHMTLVSCIMRRRSGDLTLT